MFSVLVDEWPRVREGLLARLEEHGPEPVVDAASGRSDRQTASLAPPS